MNQNHAKLKNLFKTFESALNNDADQKMITRIIKNIYDMTANDVGKIMLTKKIIESLMIASSYNSDMDKFIDAVVKKGICQ